VWSIRRWLFVAPRCLVRRPGVNQCSHRHFGYIWAWRSPDFKGTEGGKKIGGRRRLIFTVFLVTHIITGFICLISGVFAMSAKKRKGRHTLSGEIYHSSYVFVFITAVTMSILHWEESAYLFYIGVFSYTLALLGYLAGKRRGKNWIGVHIGGMLGSYIGIVTATIVVNVPNIPILNGFPVLIFWFLPTIIGTPFIIKAGTKFKPRKPKDCLSDHENRLGSLYWS
jgi:hypothetical protein